MPNHDELSVTHRPPPRRLCDLIGAASNDLPNAFRHDTANKNNKLNYKKNFITYIVYTK